MLFKKKRTEDAEMMRMIGLIIDGILESVKDGKPHDILDIAEEMEIPHRRLNDILELMLSLGLIEKRIKITKSGLNFLNLPEP